MTKILCWAKRYRGHLHKLKFVQVTANFLLNLVDQERVTFHALQLSHRNDRQKKWASGSFLAKTDETCIFRLVPRRFLWDYPIIRSKRMAYLKSAQKTELIHIVFKVLRGLSFFLKNFALVPPYGRELRSRVFLFRFQLRLRFFSYF